MGIEVICPKMGAIIPDTRWWKGIQKRFMFIIKFRRVSGPVYAKRKALKRA
jgi:hypothetical protein